LLIQLLLYDHKSHIKPQNTLFSGIYQTKNPSYKVLLYTLPMVASAKYSTGLSGKAGLVDETFVALRLVANGKLEADVKAAVVVDDLLGKATHESRNAIWAKLHQRYFRDWERAALLSKLVSTSTFELGRLFVYYEFCRSESILYDAVTQPIYSRFQAGFSGIEISDLQAWLDGIQADHPEVMDWSPQTRKKVLSNILTVIRDFGLMSGVNRKSFERVFVPASLAGYVLYSLQESLEKFGPRTVIESPDWRLFFLDEGDVVTLLKELAHEGHCRFQKQGEIMTLELTWPNLEGYVEAVTR